MGRRSDQRIPAPFIHWAVSLAFFFFTEISSDYLGGHIWPQHNKWELKEDVDCDDDKRAGEQNCPLKQQKEKNTV